VQTLQLTATVSGSANQTRPAELRILSNGMTKIYSLSPDYELLLAIKLLHINVPESR
jgi:hypothetical protein